MQSNVTLLRKLAACSEYGAQTDELIGVRLVTGLKNQDDKVRLLRELSQMKKALQITESPRNK